VGHMEKAPGDGQIVSGKSAVGRPDLRWHATHESCGRPPPATTRQGASWRARALRRAAGAALAGAVFVAVLAGPLVRPVAAVEWALAGGASAGVTDNSLGTPQGHGSFPDGFLRTTVGGNLLFPKPRVDNRLTYVLGANTYLPRARRLQLSHELGYNLDTRPSRFTQLGLNAGVSQGRTNDIDLLERLDPRGFGARPTGDGTFIGARTGQSFGWDFAPSWGFNQSAGAQWFMPLQASSGRARSLGLDGGLGLAKSWTADAATLGLRLGYGHTFELRQGDQVVWPERYATFGQATLGWNHRFGPSLGMGIGAGVLFVQVPERLDPIIGPAASASVGYRTSIGGVVGLSADRGVHANALVGDVFVQEGVGLRVAQPFGLWDAWNVHGGLSHQRSRSVYSVMANEGRWKIWAGRMGVSYDTGLIWRYALDADFIHQDVTGQVRAGMALPPHTLRRLVIMATVEGRYPPERPKVRPRREREDVEDPSALPKRQRHLPDFDPPPGQPQVQ
jgi:hypothetical protein